MSSPFIASFTGEASGTLKGKAQVRDYWQAALDRMSDLRFELLEVCVGVDSIAIYYNAVLGKRAVEVFSSMKVARFVGHWLTIMSENQRKYCVVLRGSHAERNQKAIEAAKVGSTPITT
nr:hypothetical protein [uncultured bacterium]